MAKTQSNITKIKALLQAEIKRVKTIEKPIELKITALSAQIAKLENTQKPVRDKISKLREKIKPDTTKLRVIDNKIMYAEDLLTEING